MSAGGRIAAFAGGAARLCEDIAFCGDVVGQANANGVFLIDGLHFSRRAGRAFRHVCAGVGGGTDLLANHQTLKSWCTLSGLLVADVSDDSGSGGSAFGGVRSEITRFAFFTGTAETLEIAGA